MKKNFFYFFFLLLLGYTMGGCKKSDNPVSQSVFVKLFPSDSSYKTGGCFQLKDGNYVIYGFDPDNGGLLPLVIKADQNGKIIWQRKLPSQFHYLTIKPTTDGNMLAVGVEGLPASSEYVCKIYSNDSIGAIWKYYVVDVKVNGNLLPDFVEDGNSGFVITGYAKIGPGKPKPFILHINYDGAQIDSLTTYSLCKDTTLSTTSICNNGNGYSICGSASTMSLPFKGIFYLRVDSEFKEIWHTIVIDTTTTLNASALSEQNLKELTVVCGSEGGGGLNGRIFTLKINTSWNWDDRVPYTDYENQGRLSSISKTSDGGYILAGTVNLYDNTSLVSYGNIYLLKLDANLHKEWSQQFNSAHTYTGVSATQTFDGGYLVGGYDHTESYIYTMMMIKTDAFGNIVQTDF